MQPHNHHKVIKEELKDDRPYSTVWSSLENSITPYLRDCLAPLRPYAKWLSTYGDMENLHTYQPHITLRYLGFTDELEKERIVQGIPLFKERLQTVELPKVEVQSLSLWTRNDGDKVVQARLNWDILERQALHNLHKALLDIPGYYFFETLEGENYTPHITLGEINVDGDNIERVNEYIQNDFPKLILNLESFAINYKTQSGVENFIIR